MGSDEAFSSGDGGGYQLKINGAGLKLEEHFKRQGERLNQLELIVKSGFENLTEEMRLSRTEFVNQMELNRKVPHVPVEVVNQVLQGYRNVVMPVVKILTVMLGVSIAAVLALKNWLPHLIVPTG